MNKLVSKNPVQRFKQGKKIQKMQNAGTLSYNEDYESLMSSSPKALTKQAPLSLPKKFRYKGNIYSTYKGKVYNLDRNGHPISEATGFNLKNVNGKWINQVPSSSQAIITKTTISPSKKVATAPSKTATPVVKKQSVVPRSGWSYGFDRSKEGIGDIAAMQRKLKAEGYYADNEDSKDDGKWGQSTENAYIRYLNKQKAMELPPEIKQQNPIEIISQPQIYQNDFAQDKSNNYSGTIERIPVIQAPYIPLGLGAQLAQAAKQYTKLAKQGGLLSRNPIERFKRNFRKVAQ